MAFQGVDVRQTSDRVLFRTLLQDAAGDIVTSGTTILKLYELQSDGSLKSYDFDDNTFKTSALTTETLAMSHRTGNNGSTPTGVWTAVLTTVTGFSKGRIYLAVTHNGSGMPTDQVREFQFGGAEGDLTVSAGGKLEVDAVEVGGTATAGVVADAVWDEARSGHTSQGSCGEALHGLVTQSGTVIDTSAGVHEFDTDLISTTNGHFDGQLLVMTTGIAQGESAPVVNYEGSTGKVRLAWPLRTAPANNDRFVIVAPGRTASLHTAVETTVGGVTSQTELILRDAPGGDDVYNGMVAAFIDVDSDQLSYRRIMDFVSSTKTIHLDAGPSFTVAADDIVRIYGFTTGDVLGNVNGGVVGSVVGDVGGKVLGGGGSALSGVGVRSECDTLRTTAKSDVKTEAASALGDIDLDHLIETTAGAEKPTVGSYLDRIMNKDGGQTFDPSADSLEAVRDRGDAAWSAAGANPQLLVDTSVASVVDQTHLRLTAAPGGDDTYNDMLVVLYDADQSDAPSIRKIIDFADVNNEVTLDSSADFTVAAGDGIRLFAVAPGTTAPTAAQVADAVLDELTSEHQSVGTVGAELHLVKAMLANKREHTVSTGVDLVHDDDGITVLRTMTPADDGDDTITVDPS